MIKYAYFALVLMTIFNANADEASPMFAGSTLSIQGDTYNWQLLHGDGVSIVPNVPG